MNRWAKKGVMDRLFAELQRQDIIRIEVEAVSLDSTTVKVRPDATEALKKAHFAIRMRRFSITALSTVREFGFCPRTIS